MADPVTMAVVGGSVGAMMNKKDPLKGALLGAVGGYGGGALMGAGSGLGASSALASAPATAGAGVMPGAVGAFGQAVPSMAAAVPTTMGGMTSAMGAGGNVAAMGGQTFSPGLMDTVKMGFSDIGKYAQQNPVLTNMASQTAQQMMQQPEARMAPAGQVSRSAIQPMDYMSLLNPQQGTVLKPQPISLLG